MVITGVIRSRFPITTQLEQMNMVASVAKWGSTPSGALKYFSTGRISSLAMAANSLGAPVKLCRAAPSVDKITPTCTTQATGHATVAVNNLFTNCKIQIYITYRSFLGNVRVHIIFTVGILLLQNEVVCKSSLNELQALEKLPTPFLSRKSYIR